MEYMRCQSKLYIYSSRLLSAELSIFIKPAKFCSRHFFLTFTKKDVGVEITNRRLHIFGEISGHGLHDGKKFPLLII